MRTITALLVVLIIAVALYLLLTSHRASTAQTYTNDTYGVSFDYPAAYALTEGQVGTSSPHYAITMVDKQALAHIPQGGELPPAIMVEIFPSDARVPLEDWVRTSTDSNFRLSKDKALNSILVAGNPGFGYTWDGLYNWKSEATEGSRYIYLLSVAYDSPSDKILADYDALLSSLRFR